MMGKTDNQMQLIVLDIDSMVPQNHLLRQIKKKLLTKNKLMQQRTRQRIRSPWEKRLARKVLTKHQR